MKKELNEIREIDEKVKSKLDYIKSSTGITSNDINEVKALKNNIYEKASKIFIYNLKKLIQLESTQKNLARKIGLSEDLLSKYKSGEVFPSIETLIFICEVYNISMDKLIGVPLSTSDVEALENGQGNELDIFEEKYYAYFLVTNIAREGAIHEGVVEIYGSKAAFKILSNGEVVKSFAGNYNISDKLIYFNLHSSNDGTAYINMIRPNVNKNKYVGGLAMLMLPSDANSKPCAQKVLLSKIKLDRELYSNNMKELLNFYAEGTSFGNIKISLGEDENAYNFIAGFQARG